ncbi:transcription termination factor 2-like [Notothenia coriiceps]|uniref:Transcription termination factor 2-like n=1 Tax=Notothenia coriiceps TaxID=8208 RepID=A0A6I9P803_9TELE|nr:PREDICTED: transcription termination factor 2-like [Notothenia coriiceps]
MGLGKTLTIIALILAKKSKAKGEVEEKEEKQAEGWISKTDSSPVVSKGTLIICPASLVHHWKMEIDRRLKAGKLSVCLYHGPSRERSPKVLAGYDVVVTTYSLVSKEAPVQKEDAEKPSKDTDHVSSCQRAAELLSVRRMFNIPIVLDVLHPPDCMTAGGFARFSTGSETDSINIKPKRNLKPEKTS